ncbi:hypothetical protein CAPTEDRAFT_217767 [Capitella teleta]|uniref:Tudor domain-containing protein 5 n=1 Tax=Capitella teleta TaxID=283909 RepID=R7UFP5_CAPTE|nr:hypothetical protein CAPTEDRAFT_217767 [Capitella teleta]|eukprot:ELU02613.1 hypothetical protein CAPTEDRAFT_217767 [Capitella teleta]
MTRVPDDLKVEIRSVLLSTIGGIKTNFFLKEFKDLTQYELNYRKYGFSSLSEFLASMPDVCRLDFNKQGQPAVFGILTNEMHENPTARKAKFKQPNSSQQNQSSPPIVNNTSSADYKHWESIIQRGTNGLFSLCIFKKGSPEEVTVNNEMLKDFARYGEIVGQSSTKHNFFIRYDNKKSAVEAAVALESKYKIKEALDRNSRKTAETQEQPKQASQPAKPQPSTQIQPKNSTVFIHNLPDNTKKDDLMRLFAKHKPQNIHISKKVGHASVVLSTVEAVPEMIKEYNGYYWRDHKLHLEPSKVQYGYSDRSSDSSASEMTENFSKVKIGNSTCAENGREEFFAQRFGQKASSGSAVSDDRGSASSSSTSDDLYDLHIKNFPSHITNHDLLEIYQQYRAMRARVIRKGMHTQYAFVSFPTWELAERAFLETDGMQLEDRQLMVSFGTRTICEDAIVKHKLGLSITVEKKGGRKVLSKETPAHLAMKTRKLPHAPPILESIYGGPPPLERTQPLHPRRHSALHHPRPRRLGGPPPLEHISGGPPPLERAAGGPPPLERAAGGPPPLERAVGGPPPLERVAGGPSPLEGAAGGPSPLERAAGGPPPLEGAAGGPPPLEGAAGGPSPLVHNGGGPALLEHTPHSEKRSHKSSLSDESWVTVLSEDENESLPPMMQRGMLERFSQEVFSCPCVFPMAGKHSLLLFIEPTEIVDDHFFYAHIEDEERDDEMDFASLCALVSEVAPSLPYTKTKMAAAQFDGGWWRVWVYGLQGSRAEVYYMDWGNTDCVSISDLRSLPDEYCEVAPFAIPFKSIDGCANQLSLLETIRGFIVPVRFY